MLKLFSNGLIIRLFFFFSILLSIMLWEKMSPRRKLSFLRSQRWPSNIGLTVFNSILLRIIFPVIAIEMAVIVEKNNWGILNNLGFVGINLAIPFALKVIISVLILDLIIYLQHVMFHFLPILWRLHRMHHTDLDFDTTTGLRFHPIEVLISMLIKIAAVTLLGAPVLAVLIFEILLNATAMFNHANVYISPKIDKYLRLIVVTPDMHRVHHSIFVKETNSNFGFNWPWWDKLCGTYRAQPKLGHTDMTIGIEKFRNPKYLQFIRLLAIPFLNKE